MYKIIFFIVFILIALFSVVPFVLANDITFTPQVPIGDFKGKDITGNSIGEYINAIYKYAIGIVGILAVVVMMFGGLRWITAAGNAEAVGSAKAWIGAALSGLVLALTSYVILYTVNPDLVRFRPISPSIVEGGPSDKNDLGDGDGNEPFYKKGCCEWIPGGCQIGAVFTEEECATLEGTPGRWGGADSDCSEYGKCIKYTKSCCLFDKPLVNVIYGTRKQCSEDMKTDYRCKLLKCTMLGDNISDCIFEGNKSCKQTGTLYTCE